jgi:putative endonuclease
MDKIELGAFGEEVAAYRLQEKGYKILERNWRSRTGEVDLIVTHRGCIVFVEVKTRTSDKFGTPEESITKNKRKRIIRASLEYLHQMDIVDRDWQVDLIGIYCTPEREVVKIEHYENVIEGPLEEFL